MVHKLTITYLLDKSQKYGIGHFHASIHLHGLNLSSSPCTCSCSRHLSWLAVPELLAFLSSNACRCHPHSPGHLPSLNWWNPCCVTMLPSKTTSLEIFPYHLLSYLVTPSSALSSHQRQFRISLTTFWSRLKDPSFTLHSALLSIWYSACTYYEHNEYRMNESHGSLLKGLVT